MKTPLGLYPTPLHPLDRLSEAVGSRTRIWVKRDDQTGLALGGNKVRKLELLLAEALQAGATALVTSGGRQSNHCRQTAAAAARLGLRCVVVLWRGARDDEEYEQSGNVLLDRLFGAEVVEADSSADAAAQAAHLAQELQRQGERAYLIPLGGSTPLGALGYVRCAEEILAADQDFSSVVLASGSGGTQAGLLTGLALHQSTTPVRGISVGHPADTLEHTVHALADQAADLLEAGAGRRATRGQVVVDDTQIGTGYGHPTPATHEALHLTATTEGLLLDPVYTGKAMAGLLHALRHSGEVPELGPNALFLHTGGQIGLFAYRRPLTAE